MTRQPLDPALAATALMKLDPGFTSRSFALRQQRTTDLLAAYHAQERVSSVWAFTETWLEVNP